MIARCCKDTLRSEVAQLNGPLVDGLEIPCRWCDSIWRFRDGQWQHRDGLAQTVDRMVAELPAVRARIAEEQEKRRG